MTETGIRPSHHPYGGRRDAAPIFSSDAVQSFGARTEPPAHEQHTLRSSPDSCKRFRSQLADGCAAQQHPGEGFTTGPRRSHTRSLPSDRVRPPALLPRRSFYGTSPGLVPFPVEFQTTTQEAPDVRASILIEPLSGSMARPPAVRRSVKRCEERDRLREESCHHRRLPPNKSAYRPLTNRGELTHNAYIGGLEPSRTAVQSSKAVP